MRLIARRAAGHPHPNCSGSDEGVPQRVGRDGLGDPGAAGARGPNVGHGASEATLIAKRHRVSPGLAGNARNPGKLSTNIRPQNVPI